MAVTSIWPINNRVSVLINYAINPGKTREEVAVTLHQIDDVIQYAADELKTETREYVTCINCSSDADAAAKDFLRTKTYWEKEGGRQCFHGYQSFKPGEVDAATAHAIGVELAQRCWGEDFEVVVATHCNTGAYHNHFVLNSVSFADGHHFHNTPNDYKYMRLMSDWLCEKYKLSVIENPVGHGKHYAEYLAEKKGGKGLHTTVREEVDMAINASLTFEDFLAFLKNRGYEFKFYMKNGEELEYPGLKPPGAHSFFRFHKLGANYELSAIKNRILRNVSRQLPFPEEEHNTVRRRRQERQPEYVLGKSDLHKLYIRYCFELGIIRDHPASVQRVPFHMREDLMILDKLDAETQILGKNHISTIAELRAHQDALRDKAEGLMSKRKELRNDVRRLKRNGSLIQADAVNMQVKEITKQLREISKEVRLCDDIALRSARTREDLELLIQQQQEHEIRKEENTWHTRTTPLNRS